MTGARGHFWRRTGSLGALMMVALSAAADPGCGGSDDTSTPGGTSSTSSTTTSTTSSSSTGGAGGAGGMGGAGGGVVAPYAIAQVAKALAFDAIPDAKAKEIYFTGIDGDGRSGVFKSAAKGDGTVSAVAAGPPFVAPFGIALGTEGSQIYVADLGATDAASTADAGRIFAVDPSNSSVLPVSGGDGVLARGLDVVREGNADQLVLSGVDATDGQPGVFKLPAHGGQISVVAKGDPLVDPSGVAVASTGEIFVCDTLSNPDKTATIFSIKDGFVSPFFAGLPVGYPCGLALTLDGATMFVLARGAAGTDEIIQIDVASRAAKRLSMGIDGYNEPAGLHRAKSVDAFAFADSKAQDTGTVFLVKQ